MLVVYQCLFIHCTQIFLQYKTQTRIANILKEECGLLGVVVGVVVVDHLQGKRDKLPLSKRRIGKEENPKSLFQKKVKKSLILFKK